VALALAPIGAGIACGPDRAPSHGAEGGLVVLPDDGPVDPDLPPRDDFHDFGHVPDGDTARHVFHLRNVESYPIAIQRLSPSCGCTVPSISYVGKDGQKVAGLPSHSDADDLITIPPGVETDLEIRIDTHDVRSKNTDRLYMVKVTTDAPDHRFFSVEAHILVESPFLVTPSLIDLQTIPTDAGGSGSCDIVQAPGFEHRVDALVDVPDDVDASITYEERLGRNVWVLHAGLKPPVPLGRQCRYLKVSTVDRDGKPYRPLEIGLTANVTEDVLAEPPRLVVLTDRGAADPSVVKSRVSSQLSGDRIRVTDAHLEGQHLTGLSLSYVPDDPDDSGRSTSWTVELQAVAPAQEDLLQGAVVVTLDEPNLPKVEIPFVVHVR